jgi:hypothetical protein
VIKPEEKLINAVSANCTLESRLMGIRVNLTRLMEKYRHPGWLMLWFLFALTGIGLRLWHWSSQILLDDEWHALNFVFNRSLLDIFMRQGLGANSVPVNVYCWITLHTTGWSEPLLRFPSLLAGIAALVILPMLVKRVWGQSVACVTTALLAVSPVVIFYSRIMRPYAPAMLLATSSVLLTLVWLKEGRRKDLMISALCGSLAIYYHLYTAIPVGVPLLVALFAAVKPFGQRLGLTLESKRPFRDLLLAGGIMAALVGVLVVIPNVLNPWWSRGIHGRDHATLDTAVTVLSLVSGTRNPVLMTIILGFLLTGLLVIVRRTKIIGMAIVLSFLVFALVVATTTQEGAHAGIQVVRYGITFIPLSFVAVAVAVVRAGEFLRIRHRIFQRKQLLLPVALFAWCPFLLDNPLWTTYAQPNNFTNHSAYQYRYDPIQWHQRSPERDLTPGVSIEYRSIPQFYLQSPLVAAAKGIVEYPVLIGDQLNLYYYYQHFHRRPVVAGFVSDNSYAPVEPGRDFVYGNWPIDSVMTAIPEPLRNRMSWNAMVDLNDVNWLRSRFKGWIIIVHRDPLSEIFQKDSPDNPMSLELVNGLSAALGAPDALDEQLAVWTIH